MRVSLACASPPPSSMAPMNHSRHCLPSLSSTALTRLVLEPNSLYSVVFAVPASAMIASMPVALMPFLQNRCVAALSRRPRADSSSLVPPCGDGDFCLDVLFSEGLFSESLAISQTYPQPRCISKPHLFRAEKIRRGKPICIAFEQSATDQSAGSVR